MSANPGQTAVGAMEGSQVGSEGFPERLGRLQRCSLAAIRSAFLGGLTAHETSAATGFERVAVQPRISELRRKGLVVASGKRRRNPSGKTAIVWIATEYDDPHAQVSGK